MADNKMNGHLWILNHFAQEPGGSGGTRHYSLARHLVDHGWSSTIIAASVELNTGRQRLTDGENAKKVNYDGVPFLWVRTPQYEGNGSSRILNMLAYSFRALLLSTTKSLPRPDIIIGSSVHPFAAWSGAILAKRYGVPFVFEVRDLWPQTLVDMGRLKANGIVTRILRLLEKWLYHSACRIITLLPKATDYIVPMGIAPEKIVWIPNGVELDNYPEPPQPQQSDVFTLMYFGAHGQANGLECVLHAMHLVNQDTSVRHKIRLRLIGEGPLKPALQKLANELELGNVEFCDPVSKRAIPSVAAEADAFVIAVRNLPNLYRFGISMNKIFDYFAASRPTIIAVNASNNPVEEACAGLTVPPDDPAALADAIIALSRTSVENRKMMGNAGRKFVMENHSYRVLAAKVASVLDSIHLGTGKQHT